MPVICGEKVMLREYRQEDIMDMRAWVNDPLVTDMLGDSYVTPQTFEMTQNFLARRLDGGYNFVIAKVENGDYLGQIDLLNVNLRNRHAEVGLVIGGPQWRGKGYGTEAMKLMLKYAFMELNLNKVYLSVDVDNTGAVRCYEKCGFIKEGIRRQDTYRHGGYHDTLMMSVLKTDWEINIGK